MTVVSSLAIIAFAALIHASFQLSVSVMTLMSGHAIGHRTAHKKLLRIMSGFMAGAAVMTMLLVSFSAYIADSIYGQQVPLIVWAACSGILIGAGLSVWRFYYRPGRGTTLWIPRSMAKYLHDRSKATKQSTEAFGLGLSSVIAELLFLVAPVVVASLILVRLTPDMQLLGILIYTFIATLPLMVVGGFIGSGHKLSTVQRWRENNKNFLQIVAGGGLFVLGIYVYVEQIVTSVAITAGAQ